MNVVGIYNSKIFFKDRVAKNKLQHSYNDFWQLTKLRWGTISSMPFKFSFPLESSLTAHDKVNVVGIYNTKNIFQR